MKRFGKWLLGKILVPFDLAIGLIAYARLLAEWAGNDANASKKPRT